MTNPLLPTLEALLFAAGEAVSLEQLERATGTPAGRIREALEELAAALARPERGLELQEVAGGYRLVTKAEHKEMVESLLQPRRQGLSQAALETLAIIAYRQPITRAEIEEVRGVQSDRALTTLIDRDLVRLVGRKEAPGRPILYGTTRRFLEYFGLSGLEALRGGEQGAEGERLPSTAAPRGQVNLFGTG